MSHPKLNEQSSEETGGACKAPLSSFHQNHPHPVGKEAYLQMAMEPSYQHLPTLQTPAHQIRDNL